MVTAFGTKDRGLTSTKQPLSTLGETALCGSSTTPEKGKISCELKVKRLLKHLQTSHGDLRRKATVCFDQHGHFSGSDNLYWFIIGFSGSTQSQRSKRTFCLNHSSIVRHVNRDTTFQSNLEREKVYPRRRGSFLS